MVDQEEDRELQKHTHAQYVALHNNEDRLLSDRFIALIFGSSFLAVVWATGIFPDMSGRLSVAIIGLLVTLGMWWVTYRAAHSAEDWRRLAIREERRMYGWYFHNPDHSIGPYGLRMTMAGASGRSIRKWILEKLLYLGGPLSQIGLGGANIISAFWIPLALAAWWIFAIAYTCIHEWSP